MSMGSQRVRHDRVTFRQLPASQEELPHVGGKERWLRFAGAAVKRYPMSKVRETQVRW